MISFLKRVTLFLLLSVLFVESLCALLIVTNLFLIGYPGKDVHNAIAKSKQLNKHKKVLIGDSVGQQLFPNAGNYDGLNSLAANQAIGMVGQFILVNNYIKAGNKIDTLIGFFNPFTLTDNLDQVFTYHYFLKPFETKENADLFSDNVNDRISKIPYHQFNKVPHIYATSWAPEYDNPQRSWTLLSPITIEYLRRIKDLAAQNDFTFILAPVPMSTSNEKRIQELNPDEIKKSGMEKELNDFFGRIEYLNDSLFSDGTHLYRPDLYTEVYKKKFMK